MNIHQQRVNTLVTLSFPEEDKKAQKRIAKQLCKCHKLVMNKIKYHLDEAINNNLVSIGISTYELDEIVRENSEPHMWTWMIRHTRDYVETVMTRFGYEVEIDKDMLLIKWEKEKHNVGFSESKQDCKESEQ